MRITGMDASVLDISIPSVLFNYKQEVSPAHIDFELTDVDEVSAALEVLQRIEVNKLMQSLNLFLQDFKDYKTEVMSVNLNTLHRHPGGRQQNFSDTDYNKNPNQDTGVVFPLANVDNQANFASIICQEKENTFLARTEYRKVTGTIKKPTDKIIYEKGRCASYVKVPLNVPSAIESLFGYKAKNESYIIHNKLEAGTSLLDNIIAWWDTVEYQPNTQFIQPDNVAKKSSNKNKQTIQSQLGTQGMFTYDDETRMLEEEPEDYDLEKIIEYAASKRKFTLPHSDIFETYSEDEIHSMYNYLEIFYYDINPEDVENITDAETLETYGITVDEVDILGLLDLYQHVVTELVEEMLEEEPNSVDIAGMKRAIIGLGADKQKIMGAPDAQIIAWYDDIYGA